MPFSWDLGGRFPSGCTGVYVGRGREGGSRERMSIVGAKVGRQVQMTSTIIK
jgi:hypothetical protein